MGTQEREWWGRKNVNRVSSKHSLIEPELSEGGGGDRYRDIFSQTQAATRRVVVVVVVVVVVREIS